MLVNIVAIYGLWYAGLDGKLQHIYVCGEHEDGMFKHCLSMIKE